MNVLVFVKLGGSLITDKNSPHTARPDVIARLMDEIRRARSERPELRLVLGHGSGSFGHVAAKKHATRGGVRTKEEWQGFIEVWREARDLNHIVLEAMRAAGLPGVAFPPSAILYSHGGKMESVFLDPIKAALAAGLIPVVNGDVIFDRSLGGTIYSTEDVFQAMASELTPDRILLCGLEEGVFLDYPERKQILAQISPSRSGEILASIGDSGGIDVTGGMVEKVRAMLALVRQLPKLQALIFSGEDPNRLYEALCGKNPGTLICADGNPPD